MSRKLSPRALALLAVVGLRTRRDPETGKLLAYYVPSSRPEMGVPGFPQGVWVSGGGDATAFKALESRELIRRPDGCPDHWVYCYEITEAGCAALARRGE